jgi:hypothetical protein
MADLRIVKPALKPGAGGPSLGQTAKAGPSKFDVISSQIAQKVSASVKLPSVAQPSAQQISSIDSGLKQRLQQTDARSAPEFFRVEMKDTRLKMDKLGQAVGKLPPQTTFSPFRERLTVIEQQFQRSGDLIQNMKDMDPKSLLNVQVQLYQLSENIGLMSKLVEQVSSGVKMMLQIQV